MKKTLQDQYLLIKEGKGYKDVFIKEAKQQFPGLIRNSATYTEVANVLKTKNIINENVIGLEPINQLQSSKKESYIFLLLTNCLSDITCKSLFIW